MPSSGQQLRRSPCGQLRLTRPGLTQLRQRHPYDAQQLQGLAGLFGKLVCVGIIVLTCDPLSHSEQDSALEEIKRASGLFAELAEATRVAEDARVLAERVFFQAKRMPYLLNWQAEALINETLAKPEVAQALRSTEQLSDALGKLPPQLSA